MWVLQLVQVGVTASPSGCCSWSKWLWQPVHMGVVAGPSGIFVYVYMCVYVWEVQQKNSYIYYKMMTGPEGEDRYIFVFQYRYRLYL